MFNLDFFEIFVSFFLLWQLNVELLDWFAFAECCCWTKKAGNVVGSSNMGKRTPKKVEKQFFVSIRQPTSKCHRYIFLDWYKLLRSSTQNVKALTKMKHSNSIFISSNLSMIYQFLWHLDLGDQTSSQLISN